MSFLGFVLMTLCYGVGHAWMDQHRVPFWDRIGISILFILGSFIAGVL